VSGYSVPSKVDWNADGVPDLLVGEGGGGYPGKVRVYPGSGAPDDPEFSDWFYVQVAGADLEDPGGGCLGIFPRVVNWDDDGRKDLLVGTAAGNVIVYRNTGTDAAPAFASGVTVTTGPAASPVPIDVGYRATPDLVDWDGDGRLDLVSGAFDGRVHIYLNSGSGVDPEYPEVTYAQAYGSDLLVPGDRSSPVLARVTGDGLHDLVVGNTNGQLLLYVNSGDAAEPAFTGYVALASDGTPIDLAGTPRSRPDVCDWNADGIPDVLIGCGCGNVHLYLGQSVTDVPVAVAAAAELLPPWPNPFNPRLRISFTLAREGRAEIGIYELTGSRVATVASGRFAAGTHRFTWDGRDSRGHAVPSGGYFVRLESVSGVEARKVSLVR
jgi:hypothetical protein